LSEKKNTIKADLLGEIIQHYLSSSSFNGMHISHMKNYNYEALCSLIDDSSIEVLSEKEVLNPYIKGFDLDIPIDRQKEHISDTTYVSAVYPTKKTLENVSIDYSRPYSSLMQKGENQFKLVFFNIEILERYMNNPKFSVYDSGYRGNINPLDEFFDEPDIDGEYIKDYGMAYIDGEDLNRAIGVFLCDLSDLTPRQQMMWKGFELSNQSNCKIHKGFVDNLIRGVRVKDVWIFMALIEEMIVINKQCDSIGIPHLFNKTFSKHPPDMPNGYRNILLPTLKNYYDFVSVLEKMIVHNLSYKTFQHNSLAIKSIERHGEDGKEKGSLAMFDEWLNKNIYTKENLTEIIIAPLRKVRKIRQKPAHELTSNEYNLNLYQEQADLVNEVYTAVRAIRLFFSNHPLARNVEVPEYLVLGENIVGY